MKKKEREDAQAMYKAHTKFFFFWRNAFFLPIWEEKKVAKMKGLERGNPTS
jgi:hypothetical protein